MGLTNHRVASVKHSIKNKTAASAEPSSADTAVTPRLPD